MVENNTRKGDKECLEEREAAVSMEWPEKPLQEFCPSTATDTWMNENSKCPLVAAHSLECWSLRVIFDWQRWRHVPNPFSSVQFSHSVVSNSLRPHGLQYTRLPCPSPTPGAYSNSCPLSWWCHPTISSFVVPFSSVNLSQHQGLYQGVSSSHQVAKLLEFQL